VQLRAALLLVVLALAAALPAARPLRAHAADCSLSAVPCLDASFPAAYALGSTLNAGTTTTSPEQVLEVSSTASWGVRIQTDLIDGRMKQFSGGAYVSSGRILANPLTWGLTSIAGSSQTPVYSALSSTPATVVAGQPGHCVQVAVSLVCSSSTVGVRHRLTPSFTDRRVAPHSYRTLVTYTASHGF